MIFCAYTQFISIFISFCMNIREFRLLFLSHKNDDDDDEGSLAIYLPIGKGNEKDTHTQKPQLAKT